jgi:hypothetical protein
VDGYQIYDGTDENGIVGTVAPGLFAQEGRCWRMVYENPVRHGTHCMQPVAWVGRWKFLAGLMDLPAVVGGGSMAEATNDLSHNLSTSCNTQPGC